MTQESRTPPPYISHRTLLNTLERFGDDPPPVIDDSVLSNLSGDTAPR